MKNESIRTPLFVFLSLYASYGSQMCSIPPRYCDWFEFDLAVRHPNCEQWSSAMKKSSVIGRTLENQSLCGTHVDASSPWDNCSCCSLRRQNCKIIRANEITFNKGIDIMSSYNFLVHHPLVLEEWVMFVVLLLVRAHEGGSCFSHTFHSRFISSSPHPTKFITIEFTWRILLLPNLHPNCSTTARTSPRSPLPNRNTGLNGQLSPMKCLLINTHSGLYSFLRIHSAACTEWYTPPP